MDIRSIVTSIDGSEESHLALEAAIGLGQRFAAHVDVLHVSSFSDIMLSEIQAQQEDVGKAAREGEKSDEVEQRAAEARRMFDKCCSDNNLVVLEQDEVVSSAPEVATVCWRQVVGHDSLEIARLGRISDLIVVPLTAAWGKSTYTVIFETALFDTGRLVYAANPLATGTSGQRIGVAWDGSREAAASIGQALPFMARAEEVWVHTVLEDHGAANPDSLTNYLGRHDITCEVRTIERRGRSVGRALLQAVEECDIDLLVMGAYGQSINEDGSYGGATRTILRAAKMPVLLAH
jgi:nucleotide-binding universal stress UspA family protein